MIRDPSDGSVRETISGGESGCARECVEATDSGGSGNDRNSDDTTQGSRPAAMVKVPPPETYTSGLPITKAKAEYLARLAKSHEWLKDYFKPKDNET